ncbi:sialate O-acetylesterase [Agrobacterium tumefaciens]|uniref:sialate O-acetylesterase n=1 Tax=Agrobacterium tumefaciens TaxID=358 RepID=UPI001572FE90|nr:sialate O-acetylesterase [Agrobacterium tumefaciens]NSY99701.1 sialate O-acetylesterase [Agrobacterium tumefaciens]NSZ40655.1 sialate O-acetylesterase [Agrobacterium tumefaciens]NTB22461.1 sialate O-acetylesterase [Agrobacterium tumefaciens]NTB27390.1 sialate O-acetylesterase [Agrobacterium tumefaciens]NTB36059.1 sialate O-acetylesterase [Agrobacterium tumefaciens]
MSFGVPTQPDPFVRAGMQVWENHFEKNSSIMSLSDQRATAGETYACFIVAGQSLSANCNGNPGDAAYVPTNSAKCDQLSIDDGGIYAAKEPMLGGETAGGGRSIFIRAADKLISAGYRQRIILINVGIGGTSSAQWNNDLWPRIVIANERAKAKGISVSGVLWQQGETDNALVVSQATYVSNMAGMIGKVRSKGLTAPWILAKSTKWMNVDYPPVRAAIDQIANGTDIFVGPDNDTLSGANRVADQTHMSVPTGVDASAVLWKDAILAAL